MAHARQADRTFSQMAVYALIAAGAAILVVVVVLSTLGPLRIVTPTADGYQVDRAAIDAGRQWELERKAQAGMVDPVILSGREWERQRRQQSGE